MNPKLLRVLKKLYKYPNYQYDREREVSLYMTETLTSEEQELLHHSGWVPNEIKLISHDDINERLRALQDHSEPSWNTITGAFIAGVGGRYPRGISPLISYYVMRHTKAHAYEEPENFRMCKVCGFRHSEEGWENVSWIRYAIHLGNIYGKSPLGAYIDLTELADSLKKEPAVPDAQDIAIFQELLRSLDDASKEETPGKYEKRLTAMKLVKGTAGTRRGILQSLAMVGILPNIIIPLDFRTWSNAEDLAKGELALNNTKGRSDLEMPWAGWQGNLGVDWDKARALFGDWLNS